MKFLFSVAILALSACATLATPQQYAPKRSQSPAVAGTQVISGDELRQTGRTELSDALRATSPVFH